MKRRMLFAAILLLLTVFPNASSAQSNEPSLDSSIESLRADLRADKVAIITQAMQLNDQESKIFWPVYRRYEADLVKVNDQRVALIKSYADKFPSITDADAKGMIDQSLDFESQRTNIKRKYAKEFQKAGLSSLTIAKFLQLEHRLDLLVDLKIASALPPLLVKPADQSTAPNQ
ncbi:hypothetical protein [Edaphobacter modestus]|uniref:LTXXQ motif family protein n=1 Tax=Edaphobacter modestus TaxID=388466 RepID=A0A4Q7YT89_9BACT|nr:hypothetical protein [Edaphobacter modestus]RZU40770.1 hypothetical protein BDD14_2248 [Edaphobacter modestus]